MNVQSTVEDSSLYSVRDPDHELDMPINSLYWSFGSHADPDGTVTLHVVVQCLIIPIIAFIGVVSNALNLAVLSELKNSRRVPIYEILLSMTEADFFVTTFVLINSAVFYLRPNPTISDDDMQKLNDAETKLYVSFEPIVSFFTFISNWNTTMVAAFRFIAVYFPLRAAQWCTFRQARAAISTTIVVAFFLATLPRIVIQLTDVCENTRKVYLICYVIICDLLPWTSSAILVGLLLRSLRSRPTSGLAFTQRRE